MSTNYLWDLLLVIQVEVFNYSKHFDIYTNQVKIIVNPVVYCVDQTQINQKSLYYNTIIYNNNNIII